MTLFAARQNRRPLQAGRTRRVAERRVRGAGDVGIAVGVGLEALAAALLRVLGIKRAAAQQLLEEHMPRGVEVGEAGLEGVAVHLGAAAQTDQAAQVAVQLDGGEARVRDAVEAVDVLRHHARHQPEPPQLADRPVSRVGLRPLQTPPPQEAARPVPLARLVRRHELVEVDRPVALILRVRPLCAAVVCQPGRCRQARARQQHGLILMRMPVVAVAVGAFGVFRNCS